MFCVRVFRYSLIIKIDRVLEEGAPKICRPSINFCPEFIFILDYLAKTVMKSPSFHKSIRLPDCGTKRRKIDNSIIAVILMQTNRVDWFLACFTRRFGQ